MKDLLNRVKLQFIVTKKRIKPELRIYTKKKLEYFIYIMNFEDIRALQITFALF